MYSNRMDSMDTGVALPLYLEVFTNNLIMSKIESFMSFHDLKSLRLVDRALNKAVLEESNFAEKSRIVLKKPELTHPSFLTFSWKPKHLKIYPFFEKPSAEAYNSSQALQVITVQTAEIITNCRSLQIYDHSMDNEGNCPLRPMKFRGSLPSFPCLPSVLRKAGKLVQLEIGSTALHLLDKRIPGKWNRNDLRLNLKTLKICIHNNFKGRNNFFPKLLERVTGLERIEFVLYTSAVLGMPDHWSSCGCQCNPIQSEFWPRFSKMVDNNRESIQHLDSITGSFWEARQEHTFKELKLPKLKSVSINTKFDEEADNLVGEKTLKFLTAHLSQLQQLNLITADKRLISLPTTAGPNLKRLELQTLYPNPSTLPSTPPLTKLINFKGTDLKELSISRLEIDIQDVYQCQWLHFLKDFCPPSLEKLEILCTLDAFIIDFECLSKFPNLTWLELSDSEEITKEFVTYICQNLVQLKHLALEGKQWEDEEDWDSETDITDDDFLVLTPDTEITPDGAVTHHMIPALAKLKKLEFLRLYQMSITIDTAIKGVKFLHLRTFQVELELSMAEIIAILKNNPSLEVISCKHLKDLRVELLTEIAESFPNFKKIFEWDSGIAHTL